MWGTLIDSRQLTHNSHTDLFRVSFLFYILSPMQQHEQKQERSDTPRGSLIEQTGMMMTIHETLVAQRLE